MVNSPLSSVARQAAAVAGVVLIAGSGVMSLIARHTNAATNLPSWEDFTATTVGDTVLLPVLIACLYVSWRTLVISSATSRWGPLVVGGLTGATAGAAVQLSWLLDPNPRLTWVLPRPHQFSWQGWYHAGFLTVVSAVIAALTAGVLFELWVAKRTSQISLLRSAAQSLLLLLSIASAWLFSFLITYDGGDGFSLTTTVASVVAPVLVLTVSIVYLLGRPALPTLACSALLAVAAAVVVTTFELDIFHGTGVALAVLVGAASALQRNNWSALVLEAGALSVCFAAVSLLAIEAPYGFGQVILTLILGLALVTLVIHATAPWRSTAQLRHDWRTSAATTVILSAAPIAAWLTAQSEPDQIYGNVLTVVYSALVVPWLFPWLLKQDMSQLMALEAANPTVTTDTQLSKTASRVALRAAAWGAAGLVALLTIVVAAGPSMGFTDGTGSPSLPVSNLALLGAVAAVGATSAIAFRTRAWSPALLCATALATAGLACLMLVEAARFARNDASGLVLLLFACVLFALVFLWEVESIVANSAMRPSWIVRRRWRTPVGVCVAIAVSFTYALATVGGTVGADGEPAPMLASFGLLCSVVVVNLTLTLAATWSLDWRDDLGAASAATPTSAASNWARYRMRGSLLQDFGLLQLLVIIGLWLPVSALARSSSVVGAVLLAWAGMLFFSQVFFESLRNSVKHIEEQSIKAGRVHRTGFFSSLPLVSSAEEKATLDAMFHGQEGPITQKDWASTLAVHQLHLNILAMAMSVVSLVGALPYASSMRKD